MSNFESDEQVMRRVAVRESHEQAMKYAAACKRDAENEIREAIEEFERQTGLQVDGIDYDRPLLSTGGTSPVVVTLRAMLP